MRTIRVLIADDHAVLRAGLRMLLGAQPDMEVVAEAHDGKAALECALACRPDVVLMDVSMPGGGGLPATREIRHACPKTQVLVLTMHDDESYLRQFLHAGAAGYVLKRAADTELVEAIRTVYRGDMFVYPSLLRALVACELSKTTTDEASAKEVLSDRERDVLKLTALGYSHQQIAERLFISIKTVETYKARVMDKLELRTRAELVRYALSRGWMEAE